MKTDTLDIKSSTNVLVFADKTSNIYKAPIFIKLLCALFLCSDICFWFSTEAVQLEGFRFCEVHQSVGRSR